MSVEPQNRTSYQSTTTVVGWLLAAAGLALSACVASSSGGSGGVPGEEMGGGGTAEQNTVVIDPKEVSGTGALSGYSFVAPPEWDVAFGPEEITIRNKSAMDNGPVIGLLKAQVGSGNLEADMDALFFQVFAEWRPRSEPDGIQYYEKGKTMQGFEYYIHRQYAQPTDPNSNIKGAYCSVLLVQLPGKLAVVAHREQDFSNTVQALSYLLLSLRFNQEAAAASTLSKDILGPWSLTGQNVAAYNTYYADGNFTKGGATSFTTGTSGSYGTITTTSFSATGNYKLSGNRLNAYYKSNDTTYLSALRFYTSRVGDRPWRSHMATMNLDEGWKYDFPSEWDSAK
jgi:hypothetical protein